jgi:molybdopterin synthase sulfur carrier subunit
LNIRLLYFASLREALGDGGGALELPPAVRTVGELRAHLAARGDNWGRIAAGGNVRCAVNQQMVADGALLTEGAEVAFFPPVTGG